MGGLNYKHFFIVPAAGKSKIIVLAESVSGKDHFLVHRWPSSHSILAGCRRVRQVFGISFIRALIPFPRAPPSWSNQHPRAPLPKTITLRVRILADIFFFFFRQGVAFSPQQQLKLKSPSLMLSVPFMYLISLFEYYRGRFQTHLRSFSPWI